MQINGRARWWNLTVLPAMALLLGSYCYFVSRHRIMWSDELFGWMLVTDPSWIHMLRAWNLGADGGGIGFYVLARSWMAIFGHHLLAFRAFSAMGIFVAFAATWFALRRFYQPAIAAIVLVVVWCDTPLVLWQLLQTRFYGVLLAACACTLLMSIRSAQETDANQPKRTSTLAWTFLANLILVSSHPFGLAYSGLLLVAGLIIDGLAKRKRPSYYVAVVSAWAILVPSSKALINSAKVGKPWFWTTKPHLPDLAAVYRPDFAPILFFLTLALFAIVLLSMLWPLQRRAIVQGVVQRHLILVPAALLFVAPVFFWVASQGRTSYFVDRYFCPFLIGVAILGAELLTHIFARPLSPEEPMPMLFAGALGLFCLYSVVFGCMMPYGKTVELPPKDFTADLAALLPRDEPVVIQRADIFDLTAYYQQDMHLDLVHPLDWNLALSPESPKWLVSATHEMENWKWAGYFSDDIVYSEPFLATHTHFAVVADDSTPWFGRRIATQPGWHVTKLATFQRGLWSNTIWQVSR